MLSLDVLIGEEEDCFTRIQNYLIVSSVRLISSLDIHCKDKPTIMRHLPPGEKQGILYVFSEMSISKGERLERIPTLYLHYERITLLLLPKADDQIYGCVNGSNGFKPRSTSTQVHMPSTEPSLPLNTYRCNL